MLEELTRPVPAIVQKLEQDQQRTWDEIVDEIATLAMKEDESSLEMGDRFLELEDRFGSKYLKKAAEEAGVTWSAAKQRLWVARKIPKGHPTRKSRLSFGHLCVIAGTENMQDWTNKALAEQLSVAKLREEVNLAGDRKARDNGEPCAECEEPLPKTGEIVAFEIGKRGRKRCCNILCTLEYLAKKQAEGEDLLEAAGHDLPVRDAMDPVQSELAAALVRGHGPLSDRFERIDPHDTLDR